MTKDTKIWPDFWEELGKEAWGLGGKFNLKGEFFVRYLIDLEP